jgi:hypothetical protein
VDPNDLDTEGQTPLMRAAAAGDRERVTALLADGADPSLVDGTGETALLKAAAGGHRGVYELLLPWAEDEERDTALAYLTASGKTNGPPSEGPSRTRSAVATIAARTAKFFGHEEPAERVERVERAEKHRKR